jgi:light-regulated signal transduction histidine kinase (bacteriophytochrome)
MRLMLVELNRDGKLKFRKQLPGAVQSFCDKNLIAPSSKCFDHYQHLFGTSGFNKPHHEYSVCPFGLRSIGPFSWSSTPRILSAFTLTDVLAQSDMPPIDSGLGDALKAANTTRAEIDLIIERFELLAADFSEEEYQRFEVAVHDARHLNSDLVAHTTILMKQLGHDQERLPTGEEVVSNPALLQPAIIYAISRDLGQALEIATFVLDPKRVEGKLSPRPIRALFERQKWIVGERLKKSNLSMEIRGSAQEVDVSNSFSLVPKLLIDNAIKYARPGTVIVVSLTSRHGFFDISCENEGDLVNESEEDRVFEKRVRGANSKQSLGSGIGLWLAKEIVLANSGLIKMRCRADAPTYTSMGYRTGRTELLISLRR